MKRLFGDNLEFAFFGAPTSVGALFVFTEVKTKRKRRKKKMKLTKLLSAILALCLSLVLLAACDASKEQNPEVNNIFLSKSELTLGVGETANLIATVSPGNAKTTLIWSSSDSSIAEVSNQGKVTAKSEGDAVIKVEAPNGVLAVCNVTVRIKTGSISGNVTYKYNNFVGNKPDTGTVVFLISTNVTSLPDSVGYGWTWDINGYEGVYATKVDGSGNYILNDIPVGEYYIVLISKNTNTCEEDAGAFYWGPVYNMFSETGKKRADSKAFLSKIKYEYVTITDGKTTSFSHDFGITYY